MRTRFIINPISGTGKQNNIEDYISKYFINYDVFFTKRPGHATSLSKQAIIDKIDILIVVGGDGTVNECLTPLINTNIALGIIPCGSGNGLANHIGINSNIKKALYQMIASKQDLIDVCLVNDKAFINVSGVGFDSHIAHLFSKLKKRGLFSYLLVVIKELSYSAKNYEIQHNKITRKIKAFMISFANGSEYGNGVKIAPNAVINDGLIDFIIVKEFPKWKIPFFVIQLFTGAVNKYKFVEIIRAKSMKIVSNNTLVHLDGEPYTTNNPIKISIIKQSLKILKPYDKK